MGIFRQTANFDFICYRFNFDNLVRSMFINLPKAFPAQQPIFPADPVSPLVADRHQLTFAPQSHPEQR